MRIATRTLLLAAALSAGAAFPAGPGLAQNRPAAAAAEGRLVVTAEGRATAVPDMATVTIGVVAEAESAQTASAEMSAAAEALLDRLEAEGIAPRDLQTRALRLSPVWRRQEGGNGARELAGYLAETTVQARVRALDRLGAVLDAAVESGANQFRGLSFGLADPQPVEDEARRTAVREGARRAALYAEAAGVALGPLLRLAEAGAPGPAPRMRAQMAASEATAVPVAEGELEVTAQIRLVYAIEAE